MGFDGSYLIIGHRGAAGLVPENTLPSFARALELGVDAVELDIHLCEGRLIVIHDDTLERTTNGTGTLASQTLAALRRLDAGQGAQIPLLEEILELLPGQTGINIELKGPGTALPLAELLRGIPDRDLLVSSFDHDLLDQFHRAAPDIRAAPLYSRWKGDPITTASLFGGGFLNLSRKLVTAVRCRAAQAAGLKLLVYTVNDPQEAQQLYAMGVQGLFTDYPDRIRSVVPADRAPSQGGTSRL
ncbi:MAG: glycerophosphodiester phosphodiesterase family protein [Pseudomonadales bacterium]